MKPRKPNLLERMKAAKSMPLIRLEDVSNLCIALRRGGLLALPGPDMANVSASLARCEEVCQAHRPPQPPPQPQAEPQAPAPSSAEPKKG